jgi:hypothetical protein
MADCSKILSIPKEISLSDNRCFSGGCEKCGDLTCYCETIHKYMCCPCCKGEKKEMYRVKLTYFKRSGKYYSEGYYNTSCSDMVSIAAEVTVKKINEILPGIQSGDFIILIEVEAAFSCPHLIF